MLGNLIVDTLLHIVIWLALLGATGLSVLWLLRWGVLPTVIDEEQAGAVQLGWVSLGAVLAVAISLVCSGW